MAEEAYENLTEVEEVEDLMADDAGPAIIDFWSSTCGPCQAMAPHCAAAAKEFTEDNIRFVKIQT